MLAIHPAWTVYVHSLLLVVLLLMLACNAQTLKLHGRGAQKWGAIPVHEQLCRGGLIGAAGMSLLKAAG